LEDFRLVCSQEKHLMATTGLGSAATTSQSRPLEDPLVYLPCSKILAYAKGQTICSLERPPNSIYLVIDGKVKVCRLAESGREVVVDIYHPDEFFGESAFIGQSRNEAAIALESSKLMAWTINEIEEIAARRPKFAIAILQLLVQRSMDFENRIESFFVDTIQRRLARALIRFSERLGHEAEHGSVQMMALTHEFLSQYVGTSREIVTNHMRQLRQPGYLSYSRTRITLHRDALQEWLRRS
jgi:CRP/FNR family cyclic AMP-dependent transcriptional regulator